MKNQNFKSELARQILHVFIGCFVIALILFVKYRVVLITLFSIFLLSIILSLISLKKRLPFIGFLIDKTGRESDIKFPGKGFIFFIAGSLLAIKLFPQDIALVAIVVLTFGDAVSNLFGSYVNNKKKLPGNTRNIHGTLAAIIISFLIALFFITPIYAATAAIVGMFAEALSIRLGEKEADDNLIVPLAAGVACYLLRIVI